jgi:tellurite methyltransferase
MLQNQLQETFGDIDIYLFDQLLKGRFDDCRRILDAGCGNGRNLVYFLRNGFDVHGVDQNQEAVAEARNLARQLQPSADMDNFRVALVEDLPFADATFDLVICSAVFHFARDHQHFDSMLRSAWRVLKPGGFLFARLASDIGIEKFLTPLGNGRYYLPDGTERYLVSEQLLSGYVTKLNGKLFEPIKTTNVQNIRCMTTWCMQAPL